MSRSLLLLAVLGSVFSCSEYDLKGESRPTTPSTTTTPATTPPDALVPDIEVDPMLLEFGFLPPGCTSDIQTAQITNVGDADLDVQDIVLTGNTDGAFWLDASPGILAPGEVIEVRVEFTPPDLLDYGTVGLQIASNDPDEGFVNVDLEGLGADDAIFTEAFAQNGINPVDVLWVVDNSGSMSGELDNLSNEFDFFINGFINLGLDYQIGVITTDMDNPAQSGNLMGPVKIITPAGNPVVDFAAAVDQGSSGSGDERGMDAAQAALTNPLLTGANAGFIRAGATLSVILVTDEEDGSNINGFDFATWLNAYKGNPALANFSAISGPTSGFFPCIAFFSGVSAEPAPRIYSAITNSGGIHASICSMDMSDMLTALSVLSSGMQTDFQLSYTPSDPFAVTVTVDGVAVPYSAFNGFTYDEITQTVTFHGTWIPAPNAVVEVTYPLIAVCPN